MELEKEQAQEFAYWCFVTRDPQLAAQKIGMDNGAALLGQRRVQAQLRRMNRLLGKSSAAQTAKAGLSRILYAAPQIDRDGNPFADGFAVERYKGKEAEYQFWDKLKACELLIRLAQMEQEERDASGFQGLLTALLQRAEEGEESEESRT